MALAHGLCGARPYVAVLALPNHSFVPHDATLLLTKLLGFSSVLEPQFTCLRYFAGVGVIPYNIHRIHDQIQLTMGILALCFDQPEEVSGALLV